MKTVGRLYEYISRNISTPAVELGGLAPAHPIRSVVLVSIIGTIFKIPLPNGMF